MFCLNFSTDLRRENCCPAKKKVDTILIFAGLTLWQFAKVVGDHVNVVGKTADFRSGARLQRSAAGGRGERRRGRSGKPGRESRRREESRSTTKSLNRFAPPSATEHGPSAAITVPPSVHLCLSLFFRLSFCDSLRQFGPPRRFHGQHRE